MSPSPKIVFENLKKEAIKDLKNKAMAALQDMRQDMLRQRANRWTPKDEAFVAAAAPPVILALIERAEGMEEALMFIQDMDKAANPGPATISIWRVADDAIEKFGVK